LRFSDNLALGLQIYQYNDISTHIAGVIQHIINIIIFTRDGTDDSLTPALTLQLLHSMPLFGTYYKMGNNIGAMVSNAMTMFSVYDRHKDETTILGKEIQAR
jgi:phage tail sheath protein FI